MSIIPFGKGDLLALPQISSQHLVFGEDVRYSKPSYDLCYSKYGFVVPLSTLGRTLDSFLDDTGLVHPEHFKKLKATYTYFRIDHKGNLWNVLVGEEGDSYVLHQQNILVSNSCWWIANPVFETIASSNILHGFLATNPTDKKINEFYAKYNHGSDLEYFSIKEIVEKLNTDFPSVIAEPTSEESDLVSRLKKIVSGVSRDTLDKLK